MKKWFIPLFMGLIWCQVSIGISEPHFKKLLDYQLSDWGYRSSTLYLDGHGYVTENRGDTGDYVYYTENQTTEYYELDVMLSHERKFESEKQQSYFGIDLSHARQKYDTEYKDWDQNFYQYTVEDENTSVQLRFENRLFHRNSGIYLSANLFGTHQKEDSDYTNSEVDYVIAQLHAGIIFGRVRDVTPMMRSLRFNERYQILTNGVGLSDMQINQLAGLYASREAYDIEYDRPDKFFWEQVDSELGLNPAAKTPYGLHYLNDVFSEPFGLRMEGSETVLALSIGRENLENDHVTYFGPIFSSRIVKNFSLNSQVSAMLEYSVDKPIEDGITFTYMGESNLGLGGLYELSDRILIELNTNFLSQFMIMEISSSDRWIRVDHYFSSLCLNYFAEDKIGISFSLNNYQTQNRQQFGYIIDYDTEPCSIFYDRTPFPSQIPYEMQVYESRYISQWTFSIGLQYSFHSQII